MGTKPVTLFPLSPMLHVWLWPRSPGAASAFSHQLGAGQGAWRGADGAPQRSPNQHRAHGLHRWHAGSGAQIGAEGQQPEVSLPWEQMPLP